MRKNKNKLMLLFMIMILLVGCQKENEMDITTYDEFIENGQVEIYGEKHDIQSVATTSYEYDGNNNLVSMIMTMNDSNLELHTQYRYENNILIEEIEEHKMHSDVIATRIHNYNDDGKRSKSEQIADKGENYTTEYQYEDKANKRIIKDVDGNLNGYIEEILDKNNNMVEETFYATDGTTGFTRKYSYEKDLLVKSVYELNDFKRVTYYEYNQLGDLNFSYDVSYQDPNDENPTLTVKYFVYEYNDNQRPMTMEKHEVTYSMFQ